MMRSALVWSPGFDKEGNLFKDLHFFAIILINDLIRVTLEKFDVKSLLLKIPFSGIFLSFLIRFDGFILFGEWPSHFILIP